MIALPAPYDRHLPPLLATAFAEDLPDVTGNAVFGEHEVVQALLLARAGGVIAGAPAFAAAFTFLDGGCQVDVLKSDGAAVEPGEVVAVVAGRARAVLAAERTALNFIAHLSGVATLTRRFVDAVVGTACRVLDTRKTTPGWRALEKHAVRCGGGVNHRMGLFDVAMLKDTHLDACPSLAEGVARVRRLLGPNFPLVVECGTLDMVRQALACGVDHIMLDNMGVDEMTAAVAEVAGRARLEASGGITLANAAEIARTGVDFISVGALTHSAPALDLSLKVRG